MKSRLIKIIPIGLLLIAGGVAGMGIGGFAAQSASAHYQLETVKSPASQAPAQGKAAQAGPDVALGNGFTYQGRLKNGSTPASGQFDFTFTLYDAASGGGPVGIGVIEPNMTVQDGLFTVVLNFGAAAFNGEARWLQIAVRPADTGSYTTLSPRQPITPAPYALFALKTKGYDNVIIVAGSGGDFTSIQSALNSITDNSATNRYLVWVAPGTYTETVTMKQWVDIEGAGQKLTFITGPGSNSTSTGTVIGANNAELRSLSVKNTGGAYYSIAMYNDGASPTLRDVSISVASAVNSNGYGIYNTNSSSPDIRDVEIEVTGGTSSSNHGVYNDQNSSPNLTDTTIAVSGAQSSFNYGLYNIFGSSPTVTGGVITSQGGFGTWGVHSSDSAAASLSNVAITAHGATQSNIGMKMYGGASSAFNSTITGSGGSEAYGLSAHGDASLTMNGVVVRASANSSNGIGIWLDDSSATIHGSDIAADAPSGTRHGVYIGGNVHTNTVTIDNSKVKGASSSVSRFGNAGEIVRVAASKLEGGAVVQGGPVVCAGVHDENYAFFAGSCP